MSLEARFSPLARIVRRRLLPEPGEVLVRVGDRVQPDDVVAQVNLAGELRVVDVADALGVGIQSAQRHIHVHEDQMVTPSTELASIRRYLLGRKQVNAPCDGVVRSIQDGQIFIRQNPRLFSVCAYIPGKVVEVFPHRGVAVETTGAFIQGIWGTGAERRGLLATMVASPAETLTWQRVGIRYRGTILVGGILEDPRVLYRARQFRLHGIVVGSILPELRPVCEQLGLSIVVTEGMGRVPMAGPLFYVLRKAHGRAAVICGSARNGNGTPEIIVPRRSDDVERPDLALAGPVQVGMQVRLTRAPHLGTIARVESVSELPQQTELGTRIEGAHVRLPDGHRVFVPYVNMEPLE